MTNLPISGVGLGDQLTSGSVNELCVNCSVNNNARMMKYLVKISFKRRFEIKFINASFRLKVSNSDGEQGKS